jgi:hypothetical protein
MKTHTIAQADDWSGLYVDGELVYQGHSIPIHVVFEVLGASVQRVEVDLDWIHARGDLPDKLADVERA